VEIAAIRPMKAVTGTLPPDDGSWAFEIKWDGMRVLAHVDGRGGLRLRSGNGADATPSYPELAGLRDALPNHDVLLDGEVVAFDESGRPSFGRLRHRMHVTAAADAARRAAEIPVVYVVFDLLVLDGVEAMALPYVDRRRLLCDLLPANGAGWQVPEHRVGDGAALYEAASERRLEGVMAKRLDSTYQPGKRSSAWVKVKVRHRQELVVGGWQPGEGGRAGRLGSLLVGYYDDSGRLRFAGKVGTGFRDAELDRLGALLAERAADEPPFDPPPPRAVARIARWVRPELVAEVEFGEWTADGILRHPSYLGLRHDKAPTDVVREG
jgi:bifunctional non-homologous end joining protein LigD